MMHMAKYMILDSDANRLILDILGWEYESAAGGIVFTLPEDMSVKEAISEIANKIIDLGLANNLGYAYELAASFFMNKIGEE